MPWLRDRLREALVEWDLADPRDAGDLRLTDELQAVVVHWLVVQQSRWMVRRVENFALVDDRTVERRTSFDFQLPDEVAGLDPREVLRVIPLATLSKRKLTAFDLRDEDDRPLPVLDTQDNGAVASGALHALAQTVLDREPRPVTHGALETIARGLPDAAEDVRRAMRWTASDRFPSLALLLSRHLALPSSAQYYPNRASWAAWLALMLEWRRLETQPVSQQLMEQLAREFILLTPATGDMRRRRVLKMRYEETYREEDVGAFRWLAVRLGWAPAFLRFPAPATGRCRSYHAEVVAPTDAELMGLLADDGAETFDKEPRDEPATRGRLHVQLRDGSIEDEGAVILFLRASRRGFLRGAVITCLLTLLLLVGGRLQIDELSSDVEAAAALLLLIPTVLAALLVRPGEHALVTSLVVGVRLMVLGVAGCAVTAAALLVARIDRQWLHFGWTALSIAVFLLTCGVALSNLLPRADKVYEGAEL